MPSINITCNIYNKIVVNNIWKWQPWTDMGFVRYSIRNQDKTNQLRNSKLVDRENS
jgi:hypothetical protein